MILLNPGPVNVSERVRQALLKPDICHREAEFNDLIEGIRDKLIRTFAPGGNFVHIVFDNEVYGSTGNQPTLSQTVRLEQVAKAAGYRHVERVRELDDAVYEAKTMLKEDGPSFLLVKVSELAEDVGRVGIEPAAMTERFRKAAVGMGGASAGPLPL